MVISLLRIADGDVDNKNIHSHQILCIHKDVGSSHVSKIEASLIFNRIYKPVTKYLHPIVNKRRAEIPESPPTTAELSSVDTASADVSEATDVAVTAKAIALDTEPATIPDEAIFAGRDPSFRACRTIDELKQACGCFLDFKRVPKIVIKTVTKTSKWLSDSFETW